MLFFKIWIKLFFWKIGFGILAKSENSFTRLSICLICLLIVFKWLSNWSFSTELSKLWYLLFNLSIVNWIGVSGFLISWANLRATFSQASYLSDNKSLSCCILSLSIIKLKFLFSISSSLSVFISGTLVSRLPFPISVDAKIKLFIDLKNLDENLIAIVIDRNNNNVTIRIYTKTNDIWIPNLLSSTV